MKLDADEKDLLESVERGEWKSVGGKPSGLATLVAPKRLSATTAD
jgi:hypothetical protein